MKKVSIFFLVLILFSGCKDKTVNVSKIGKIIDGDSISLANGDKVDLIGIASPEIDSDEDLDIFIKETGFTNEEVRKLSVFAKTLMEEYFKDHMLDEVLIVNDMQKKNQQGKIFAYVYVNLGFSSSREFSNETPFLNEMLIKHNGTYWIMLNAALVQSGLAIPDPASSNSKFSKLFKNIYREIGKERLLNTFKAREKELIVPSVKGSHLDIDM